MIFRSLVAADVRSHVPSITDASCCRCADGGVSRPEQVPARCHQRHDAVAERSITAPTPHNFTKQRVTRLGGETHWRPPFICGLELFELQATRVFTWLGTTWWVWILKQQRIASSFCRLPEPIEGHDVHNESESVAWSSNSCSVSETQIR